MAAPLWNVKVTATHVSSRGVDDSYVNLPTGVVLPPQRDIQKCVDIAKSLHFIFDPILHKIQHFFKHEKFFKVGHVTYRRLNIRLVRTDI